MAPPDEELKAIRVKRKLIDSLGKQLISSDGSTSSVFEARVVLKEYEPEYAKQFEAERKALTNLKHEHIINMYAYADENEEMEVKKAKQKIEDNISKAKPTKQSRRKQKKAQYDVGTSKSGEKMRVLLLEYMPDNLAKKFRDLSWVDIIKVLTQLADAITYLHEYGPKTYIHQDIKPENILIDKQNNIKLADFGSILESSQRPTFDTFRYASPEAFMENEKLTQKSDVYSFGVIALSLIGKDDNVGSTKEREDMGFTLHRRGRSGVSFPNIVDRVNKQKNEQDAIHPDFLLERKFFTQAAASKMRKMALQCTMLKPIQRPEMKTVFEDLKNLKK